MWDTVESMKVRMPSESRVFCVDPEVYVIVCSPTTRSRDMSLANVKETLLGVNLEAS